MAHNHRRVKASWLTRQFARAHNVLADPTATNAQRQAARCRLNRSTSIARRLRPVPPMKRELKIDRQRRVDSELRAWRSKVA
jgi:hypothetical protein